MEETEEKITELSNQKGIARNSRFTFMGTKLLENFEKMESVWQLILSKCYLKRWKIVCNKKYNNTVHCPTKRNQIGFSRKIGKEKDEIIQKQEERRENLNMEY